MKYVACFLLTIVMASLAFANSITMMCTSDDGGPDGAWVVDLDRKTIKWGPRTFPIVQSDGDYITAVIRSKDEIGGWLWVLNRNTGEYVRVWAGVGISEDESPDKRRLGSTTDRGKCKKKLF